MNRSGKTANMIALIRRTRISLVSLAAMSGILIFVPCLKAQNTCQNISGHISGQIIGPNSACNGALTETGTFTGQPAGTFVACITNIQNRGDGALVFDLTHTYVTDSGDTFTTSDHVIAGPINPPIYRINNRASIIGGTGLYEDAFGFIRDHGTVDLGAGVVSVDQRPKICLYLASAPSVRPCNHPEISWQCN